MFASTMPGYTQHEDIYSLVRGDGKDSSPINCKSESSLKKILEIHK